MLHRYLNRPEDDSQKENRKESEYGVHFLGTYKKCEKKKFQTRLKTCHFSSDSRGDDHSHDYFQKFNNFSYGADYKPPAASFTAASSSPLILSEFSTNVKSPNYFVNENVDKKIMNRKTDDEKTTLLCVSLDSTNCFSSSSKKSPVNRCSVPSNGCLPFQETDDGFNKKAKFQSMPIKVSVKLESNGTEQCGKNNPETWSEKLNPFNLNGARQNAYLDSKIINEKNENYRKFSGKRFNRFRSAETSLSEVNLTSTIANKSMKQKNCRSIISFDEYSCQVCEKYHEHAVEMKAQQEDAFDGRPESAPVKKNKRANLINAHQRSLSLPKSFRPEKKEIININKRYVRN